MSDKSDHQLYEKVVSVTHVYLGPAADRFISRQIQNHLHKDPIDLSPKDLVKLLDWIRLSVSLLTDDSELIEEYLNQLRKIAHPRTTKRSPQQGKGHDKA